MASRSGRTSACSASFATATSWSWRRARRTSIDGCRSRSRSRSTRSKIASHHLHYYAQRSSFHRVDVSQLMRGTLDAATLAVVAEQDGYGYDILRRLRAAGLTQGGGAAAVRQAGGGGPAPPLLRDHRSRARSAGGGARRLG